MCHVMETILQTRERLLMPGTAKGMPMIVGLGWFSPLQTRIVWRRKGTPISNLYPVVPAARGNRLASFANLC